MDRTEARDLLALLGGRRAVGTSVADRLGLVPLVRRGLPYAALRAVSRSFDVSAALATRSLRLPERTLARRRAARRLDTGQSEKVLRLAQIALHARRVLGTRGNARSWLGSPNRALGGVTPLSLLDTDVGARAVEDVLTRIEHGVVG